PAGQPLGCGGAALGAAAGAGLAAAAGATGFGGAASPELRRGCGGAGVGGWGHPPGGGGGGRGQGWSGRGGAGGSGGVVPWRAGVVVAAGLPRALAAAALRAFLQAIACSARSPLKALSVWRALQPAFAVAALRAWRSLPAPVMAPPA